MNHATLRKAVNQNWRSAFEAHPQARLRAYAHAGAGGGDFAPLTAPFVQHVCMYMCLAHMWGGLMATPHAVRRKPQLAIPR